MRRSDGETLRSSDYPAFAEYVADGSDPEDRDYFAVAVVAAWVTLGFMAAVAGVALGYVTMLLFGDEAGKVTGFVLIGAALACCAGAANALWRKYWYVPQARRRLRKYGADDERYRRSLRRTLPPNSSLLFQGAVWILTLVIAAPTI